MNTTEDDDRDISIDCKEFRTLLQSKIKELAVNRIQTMLEKRTKRQDDLRDQDFTVS